MMTNTLLHRAIEGHVCKRSIRLRPDQTEKTDDSLFYTFEGGYQFWQVKEVQGNAYKCAKILIEEHPYDYLGLFLPWNQVGCFLFKTVTLETQVFTLDDVVGKAMRVKNWILTVPNESLFEAN